MSRSMLQTARRPGFGQMLLGGALAALAIAGVIWPGMALFVGRSLVVIAPLVIPGIALAAWIVASGADTHIAQVFNRRIGQAVVAATAIGAVTPVCGVTVLPLMVGLLAAGVPLAPVMAFWLSSPVTDPAMLAATAATLGVSFALAKTAAALLLGLIGGWAWPCSEAATGCISRSGRTGLCSGCSTGGTVAVTTVPPRYRFAGISGPIPTAAAVSGRAPWPQRG